MTERQIFMAVPEDLFFEATEIARMQGVSLTHLIVEALSESVETHQRRGWVAERALALVERRLQIRSTRQHRAVYRDR